MNGFVSLVILAISQTVAGNVLTDEKSLKTACAPNRRGEKADHKVLACNAG
jgi:hypothetical protein